MKIHNDGSNPVGLYPTEDEYYLLQSVLAYVWHDIRTYDYRAEKFTTSQRTAIERMLRQIQRDRSI